MQYKVNVYTYNATNVKLGMNKTRNMLAVEGILSNTSVNGRLILNVTKVSLSTIKVDADKKMSIFFHPITLWKNASTKENASSSTSPHIPNTHEDNVTRK